VSATIFRAPAVALSLCATFILVSSPAAAYRPFDGTDADVAALGEFELEMGPAHWYKEGGRRYVIAPATVLNLGLVKGTELVVDLKDFVALNPAATDPRFRVLDTDVLLKHVFREGVLQGGSGISIAAEGGLLTPELHGATGLGASLDVIVSYRWSFGTFHWNEQVQYTREHEPDVFTGVILEGPDSWTVRPVGEVFLERDFGADTTRSALLGAIWTWNESFVVDAAVRAARIGDVNATEARLGFTWTFPVWQTSGESARHLSKLLRVASASR
jgi:hypothetical protein